ncbi:Panacea domain-containing protein [Lactobacillus kefiranofaciens]|uniref:DUF4065 domain-containing protein n=2 Tax=Lactobacillus kefiranofaciens TaxID=267818 RepID=A0AAX3UGQ7_9LACO|nr:type II toxin-antitoxin system antitoxin SocA domain-containing protein [Lactobacillus kefiranofaciens]KRL26937.1 XRE family transcriptional regulator [Lactobacillus kefiranofaciens subsp. kefirgranum DSM 10550 = JCM 8572]KRM21878.1 XRE family transcriptional regulator [Lactobacillus kefiranofaciens subsp. kefiranofaciens DSM 5016 = JCM 6985]MCJ2172636.1 DUF4065 domain-containing protein [Lactobacillus kefiranofaciens]MCP9331339.1 DUF4065 domain-containing protein [Lactobacillus kefiranofaci
MKALQVVNWMRVKNYAQLKDSDEKYVNVEPLTQMRAMKLLYYMQAASLVLRNESLFDEPILAWKMGPIVKSVYNKYNGQWSIVEEGSITDADRADYNLVQKGPEIRDIVNTIYDYYGQRSASDLMEQTHHEKLWQDTPINQVIKNEVIKDYFKNIFLKAD